MAFRNSMPSMNWNNANYNEIALNQIYSEHCEKEAKGFKPKLTYTANPCASMALNNGLGSRQEYVTDKVGLVATGQGPVEMPTDPDIKAVVDGLLGATKTPHEKYDAPQTSSQEVGWFHKPLVPENPRFVHKLRQGEATQFAETYTKKMAGEHVFHGKSGRYLKY